MALVVVLLIALLGAACGKSPTEPSSTSKSPTAPAAVTATSTRLSFTSDPTSFVGQGQSRTYTLQNAKFQPVIGQAGGYLSVVITPTDPSDTSRSWSAVMMAPVGRQLSPGTYTAGEVSFDAYWFNFGGGGRGCGSGTTATYTIHEIAMSGETLQRLRLSFTVYCGGSSKVSGDIVILADPWR
jgi:hypothetical protein